MPKLSDLKNLVDAAKAATPPATPPAPPAARSPETRHNVKRALGSAKHADGDVDLQRAFADVKPLPPANRAPQTRVRPAPIARHTLADERDVLHASKYGNDPAPQTWDIGQEFEPQQTYVREGIGIDVAGKLRRGFWTVQSELDLHGFTTDAAHDALADFVFEARTHGLRCVRVIHGKGLTSPGKEPVLKSKVRRWLAHWDDVLAYAEAPQHAGGGGAVLVLLKGR